MPLFSILLPVHRPPALLPIAVDSVLAQSQADWELFIVCDGVPDSTAELAHAYQARDSRIRARLFPKGERNGEAHRHTVLQEARGTFVAHIGDDDIWFPGHLVELGRLLEVVEFGNLLQCEIMTDGEPRLLLGDLALEATRADMLARRFNFFGPTVAGYRLETYRRLPVGWSPAPPRLWSDLFMWSKFLALPGISAATRFSVQAAKPSAAFREGASLEERRAENARLAATVADPAARSDLVARAWRNAFEAAAARRSLPRRARALAAKMLHPG